jgi:hypothetical protein
MRALPPRSFSARAKNVAEAARNTLTPSLRGRKLGRSEIESVAPRPIAMYLQGSTFWASLEYPPDLQLRRQSTSHRPSINQSFTAALIRPCAALSASIEHILNTAAPTRTILALQNPATPTHQESGPRMNVRDPLWSKATATKQQMKSETGTQKSFLFKEPVEHLFPCKQMFHRNGAHQC